MPVLAATPLGNGEADESRRSVVGPLLPTELPKPKGGRPRISDRAALTGIVFVLKSGIGWDLLPQEMGCGSGMACWWRLRERQRVGSWGVGAPAPHAAATAG
jgi:transposase